MQEVERQCFFTYLGILFMEGIEDYRNIIKNDEFKTLRGFPYSP